LKENETNKSLATFLISRLLSQKKAKKPVCSKLAACRSGVVNRFSVESALEKASRLQGMLSVCHANQAEKVLPAAVRPGELGDLSGCKRKQNQYHVHYSAFLQVSLRICEKRGSVSVSLH
jgi:hypothetical protein